MKKPLLRASFVVVLALAPLLAQKTADPGIAPLPPAVVDELTNLPYGLTGQKSLFLRYKHVESVQFFGSGQRSKFSFRRGSSMIPEGLSLRLKNDGEFVWASGIIKFKKPMDLTKYNSIVVWVRTDHPGLRFWIGVQEPGWTVSERPQARTDVLPFRGFPKNQPVQLVIPYSRIYAESGIDYRTIDKLAFEFGQDTVGNSAAGQIDILGIAFVEQKRPIARVRILQPVPSHPLPRYAEAPRRRRSPRAHAERVAMRPAEAPAAPAPAPPPVEAPGPERHLALPVAPPVDVAHPAPLETTVEPIKGPDAMPPAEQTAAALLRMSDQDAETLYKKLGLDGDKENRLRATWDADRDGAPHPYKHKWIQPYARHWPDPAPPSESADAIIADKPRANTGESSPFWSALVGAMLLGFIVSGAWIFIRRPRAARIKRLPKLLHAVRWPFSTMGAARGSRMEENFWRGLAAKGGTFGWLSAPDNPNEKDGRDVFFGETFFRRQVRLAGVAGIRLLPSLSFVRTVFRSNVFFANPRLFHFRPLLPDQAMLPDAELRSRLRNAFPVDVPNAWRRKHKTGERLIVDRRLADGAPLTANAVGYNLAAPELRAHAIRSLSRLAQFAPGVRIEDAADLLNERRNVGARLNPAGSREFWAEVIGAVKAKRPGFLFVADDVGDDPRLMREIGFDYFEYPLLDEALLRGLRLGDAGAVSEFLASDSVRLLKYAIHDVARFVPPTSSLDEIPRANLMATALCAFLPGLVQHDDRLPRELAAFLDRMARSALFRKGHFTLLPSTSPTVLAFGRWRRRGLAIVLANFSNRAMETAIRFDPLRDGLNPNKLYMFKDGVRGHAHLKNLLFGTDEPQAFAHWGQSLRDSGLRLAVPGLSVRLISVNLTRPVPNETPKHIHQLHQA